MKLIVVLTSIRYKTIELRYSCEAPAVLLTSGWLDCVPVGNVAKNLPLLACVPVGPRAAWIAWCTGTTVAALFILDSSKL